MGSMLDGRVTDTKSNNLRRPSRLRIVDSAYHSLEDAILTGQLRPGTRLVETSVADQLGVSRTIVREAFLMLERRGLVVSKPRRGTFVTRISRSDALDIGYTRSLLEAFAVTVGYPHIDEAFFEQLEDLLDEMARCSLPEEFPELVSIDLKFHGKLVQSAAMPRLFELWSSLGSQIGALYIRGVEEMNLHTDDLVKMHRRLVDAVRVSPAEAQRAIIHHYVRADGAILGPGLAAQETLNVLNAALEGTKSHAGIRNNRTDALSGEENNE